MEDKIASKEDILQAKIANYVDVIVEEWGRLNVRLLAMSATDTFEFMRRSSETIKKAEDSEEFVLDDNLIWAFIKSAVDENFKPMFTLEEKEVVMSLPFHGFVSIQKAIMELNKLTLDMSEVIDQAKNDSGETSASSSSIVSPSSSER